MIINGKLKNAGLVFMNSLGKQTGNYNPYEQVNVKNYSTIEAKSTDVTFSCGAPDLSRFDCKEETSNYTFKPGQVLDLIENYYHEKTYWFDNGKWYEANIDCVALLLELEYEEEDEEE